MDPCLHLTCSGLSPSLQIENKCLLVLHSPSVPLLFLPSPLPLSPHPGLSSMCLCVFKSVCVRAGVLLYARVLLCLCVAGMLTPKGKGVKDFPDIKGQVADREKRGDKSSQMTIDHNAHLDCKERQQRGENYTHTHTRSTRSATHSHSFHSLSYASNTHTQTHPLKCL